MRYLILIFFIIRSIECVAQKSEYTAYTVANGLPSNHVYQCVQDDKGFLWVATDAGIARFDGKYFQVFTTADGLPDNEVIQVAKEKNGRIWVNCLRQSPAYFDEVKNKFIVVEIDQGDKKKSGTVGMSLYSLPDGGVIYSNENGSFLFVNTKLVSAQVDIGLPHTRILSNEDGSIVSLGRGRKDGVPKFFHIKNNKIIDSCLIEFHSNMYPRSNIDLNMLYLQNYGKGIINRFYDFKYHPLRYQVDSIKTSEPFFSLGFTESSIYILSNSGKIYVYNKFTLQQDNMLKGDYLPNSYFVDNKGDTWVSTVDKGLLVHRNTKLAVVKTPKTFTHTNFISLAYQNQKLLAGNYYGEVIESKANHFLTHTIIKKTPSRIRKIITYKSDVYTISEDGIYLNYKTPINNPFTKVIATAKTALQYNDSVIVIGTVVGLMHLNTITKSITKHFRYKRAITLAKSPDGLIYFGSTDGLYKYDIINERFESLSMIHPQFSQRVAGISITSDGLIWVATSGNGLVVIKDDKVISHLTDKQELISNATRSISIGKGKQIWLGTTKGISIINYTIIKDSLVYKVQNLSSDDGIASNEVNEMITVNDTVYAATGAGISIIPTDISIPRFNIPVQLIQIAINQRDTILAKHYRLTDEDQYIQMRFAAIEIGGHFKNLQYTIGENQQWTDLNGMTLNLKLTSGEHYVKVRAVDANGHASEQVAMFKFHIDTSLYKTFWFWLIITVISQLSIIYWINQKRKKRREAKLSKEILNVQTAALEQQAFTSLMNPHFMFNALNSIQHYINVQDRQRANRYLSDFASLLRKSFEAAQKFFIPLEEELENIRIYLRLEQMRFPEKFTYSIDIADKLDLEKWMIPTMMLQPLLENAILHGLMPSSLPGQLTIEIEERGTNLIIKISDNGIGIQNSQLFHQQALHKSHGTQLIRKRISALNHFGKDPINIHVTSAFDDLKNPGLSIKLTIPFGLYNAWLAVQHT